MTDRRIVVLAGGLTHEREVSLRSGSRVAEALRRQGHEVHVRDVGAELLPWLRTNKPDAAVITLHGGRGENGAVQSVVGMMGIPYLGTPASNCRLAWDKATAKTLIDRAGYHTPSWITLSHDTFRDLGAAGMIELVVGSLGIPLVVKPHQGGSALGVGVVRTPEQLPEVLVGAFAYGSVVIVEQYIAGTEIAVSVVDGDAGPIALPAVEIEYPGDIFDYEARYTAGLTTYYTPARLSEVSATAAAELAVAAHMTLGLRDLSRTDAIVDADGTVHFLEVNVSPGLTETSMMPMAIAEAGEDLGVLYSRLIETAIRRCK
ncbi:D-alanine--D-alanine ligase [Nakamurella antarctica]|uniref:D-alanine--D-alanine ligase n=1 Tax=Nakamurella antarctica TaxID=1902245 RepID=A0A3G8ZPW5_9ACTN|nr:D-alanine--D-alanine ligase [Nakamurella antarctica]AZI59279.1 D-alanine--D-alanine ligase [Nakamurella antarctica]